MESASLRSQARHIPGSLRGLGATTSFIENERLNMNKSLIAAALLSTAAAFSFAQTPAAKAAPATPAAAPAAATTPAPAASAPAKAAKKHAKKPAAAASATAPAAMK
jgi:hypothetical protein